MRLEASARCTLSLVRLVLPTPPQALSADLDFLTGLLPSTNDIDYMASGSESE